MPPIRRLYKAGHSIVLAIPSYILDHLGVEPGDSLSFDVSEPRSVHLTRASIHEIKSNVNLDANLLRLTCSLLTDGRPPDDPPP